MAETSSSLMNTSPSATELLPLPSATTTGLPSVELRPKVSPDVDVGTTEAAVTVALDPGVSAPLSLDSLDPGAIQGALRTSLYWGEVGDRRGYSVDALLRMALKANPNWGTYAANHAAAHAELVRACALPNPEVEVELGRERAREGGASAGTWSLAFEQPIEMPGKRLARRVEAEAGFAVVAGQALEFESSLRADVVEAYWTIQFHAAQERLWQTMIDVAVELQEIARTRVELGVAGTVEEINTGVEVLRARRERDAARRRMLGARAALNALVGGCLGSDFRLSDRFPGARPVSLKSAVEAAVSGHPRLVRLAAELEQRYASLDRERTSWWPDLRIGARKMSEMDSESVAVTAGIEVPLFSRNQGGVAKAAAEAQRTYNDITIAMNELRRDVETAWQQYELAREQIASFEDGLRSATEQAVSIAWVQYRGGIAGYLDVLTARRQLQETQQGYIQALFDAATARARLDRATGCVIRGSSVSTKGKIRKGSAEKVNGKSYE